MKKILTLICTLLCANVLFAQVGTTFWMGYIQYQITSTNPPEMKVKSAEEGYITTANIPETVTYPYYQGTTYSVTSIGGSAFSYCYDLTSVTIPNSVTSIGNSAFAFCSSLTSVTIPNSVTSIGEDAFRDCSSLTSITIGNGVTSIGNEAFRDCSSLTSVTCLRGDSPSLGSNVFYGTPNNKTLTIPCSRESDYTDWQNATTWASIDCIVTIGSRFTIGDLTYEITSETEVKVYDSNSSITTANIPETVTYQGTTYSVTSIGDNAFSNWFSSLTSVTIPNSVTSIGNSAFYNCGSLTSVTIPNSVTSIGESAFSWCNSLTSVTIGNSVTSIRSLAFNHCSSLTSITIPNSVTYIGSSAFSNCSSLTSVTIPNSVTSIGNYAFRDCSSLTSVTCLRSISPSLGIDVFDGTTNNKTLTIPCGCESEYTDWQNATTWASIDCIVQIGSLFTIGDLTYEVTSETELKVQACTQSATSVVIPETVTYQGTTYSITSIGEDVFAGCNSLTSMTIEMNNVWDFGNIGLNSTLQNLTLGENVTSIASGAFNNYNSLQNVTCLATTPPTLADNTVFPYPNIATLTVPCGTLEAYSAPTSLWNTFFAGRISDGYNVVATANDNAFGSVAVESDCYTATLTATASDCYEFLRWNDGNTENPRLVSLISDTAFSAIFSEVIHNTIINASINPGETYTEYGFNASEAGTYILSVTTEGCDSTITLILTVNSSLLEAEAESISFYPNPTDSKVNFSQAIEKVEVIDLTGRCVLTFSNAREINIESLPSGAYYLRLTNNDKAIMRKVIKE